MSSLYRKFFICFMGFAVLNIFNVNHTFAQNDTTITERTKEAAKDTKRKIKKGGRKLKDKTCEVVNGKTKCIADKAKHGVQNTLDKASDAVD